MKTKSIRQRVHTCLIELTNIYLHLPVQLHRGSNGCKNNENAIRSWLFKQRETYFSNVFQNILHTFVFTDYLRWRTSESLALTACFLYGKNQSQKLLSNWEHDSLLKHRKKNPDLLIAVVFF